MISQGRVAADALTLDRLCRRYDDRRERDRVNLEAMVFYAQAGSCRWRIIRQHLEDVDLADASASTDSAGAWRCGHCDSCLRLQRFGAAAAASAAAAATSGPSEAAASPRFKPGDAVRVRRFGAGEVVQTTAGSITIRFSPDDQRCFDPAFVMPARRRRRAPAGVAAGDAAAEPPVAAPVPAPTGVLGPGRAADIGAG